MTLRDERATSNGYQIGDGPIVRGDVYDMLTSKPIPAAQVVLEKYNGSKWEKLGSAVADADGHFEAKHLPLGGFRVTLQASGYVSRALGYVTLNKQTLKIFSARLLRPSIIGGTVTDTSGKPVANAMIEPLSVVGVDGRRYSMPDSPTAVSDADGNFTLAKLPGGYVQIHADAAGMQQLDVLTIYKTPAQDVKLRLTATGKAVGHVSLQNGHAPQGRVSIFLNPPGDPVGKWGGSQYINADGYSRSTMCRPERIGSARSQISPVTPPIRTPKRSTSPRVTPPPPIYPPLNRKSVYHRCKSSVLPVSYGPFGIPEPSAGPLSSPWNG